MPTRPVFLLLLVSLGVALAAGPAAGPAAAADAREIELPLQGGKTVKGVVVSASETEVVLRVGEEEVRRVPWTRLAPLGLFRVRAALAPAADGQARLELAELAVELGLHAEARVEYEKALALGAIHPQDFQAVVWKSEHDAVEAGIRRAQVLAEEGEFEQALQIARDLKLHFSGAPNARAIDRLIGELLKDVRKLQKEANDAAEELARIQVEARRNKEILERRLQAVAEIEKGRSWAERAVEPREKGNVTKARKYAEKADEHYMKARRHLGRLRRILPRDDERYREVLGLLNELDREHFELLHVTAWFFWEETVYTRADEYAARASYIDPVHPDLLELRTLLRVSRIRYRLSDVTNARPIIR